MKHKSIISSSRADSEKAKFFLAKAQANQIMAG
jgi:hypothetical protein